MIEINVKIAICGDLIQVPKNEKMWLISPPPSPPEGWTPVGPTRIVLRTMFVANHDAAKELICA